MASTFTPHLHILPQAQLKLWPQLRGVSGLGFVLYGGTAIALRLGHRQSVDFDFFSANAFEADEIFRSLAFLEDAKVVQQEQNALSLLVEPRDTKATVKISFFGDIEFGRVGTPEETNDGVLLVASMEDLMATKLKVLLQRVESKDYRDIVALLAGGMDLPRGLAFASALFAPNFPAGECLRALTYFEGGDLQVLTEQEKDALNKAASEIRALPEVERLSKFLIN